MNPKSGETPGGTAPGAKIDFFFAPSQPLEIRTVTPSGIYKYTVKSVC